MRLSIVILSYNVKELLENSIRSIYATFKEPGLQIIVVDNNSSDDSVRMIEREFPEVKLVKSKINTGFAKGNNLARPYVKSDFVLFLNPDTLVKGRAIEHCLATLKKESDLGAITCRVELPNGTLDYSCHRGLPSVWNTFCHWSMLGKVFPKSPIFAGYSATYLNTNTVHDIECITGAFFMTKKELLDKIGWWDEDYWWNGDDIEICYKIKKAGYKIRYDPTEKIVHYKGSSSGLWKSAAVKVDKETKLKAAKSAAKAMGIFVRKHENELGSKAVIFIVKLGIFLLEKFRLAKISLGLKYA